MEEALDHHPAEPDLRDVPAPLVASPDGLKVLWPRQLLDAQVRSKLSPDEDHR